MALHRDIHWIGRQWAVTGFGMQTIDRRLGGTFDIEIARLWDEGLAEDLRQQSWFNAEDFEKGLAMARRRHAEQPRQAAPVPQQPDLPPIDTRPVPPPPAVPKTAAPRPPAPRPAAPRPAEPRPPAPRAAASRPPASRPAEPKPVTAVAVESSPKVAARPSDHGRAEDAEARKRINVEDFEREIQMALRRHPEPSQKAAPPQRPVSAPTDTGFVAPPVQAPRPPEPMPRTPVAPSPRPAEPIKPAPAKPAFTKPEPAKPEPVESPEPAARPEPRVWMAAGARFERPWRAQIKRPPPKTVSPEQPKLHTAPAVTPALTFGAATQPMIGKTDSVELPALAEFQGRIAGHAKFVQPWRAGIGPLHEDPPGLPLR
jgi:hypothetical protein